jgi:hypothetical protein
MPIPKQYEELYGKIIGHMINIGKSHEEAKAIAEKAIADKSGNMIPKAKKKKKGKKHGKEMQEK